MKRQKRGSARRELIAIQKRLWRRLRKEIQSSLDDGEWEDAAADASALSRWDEQWLAPLRAALVSGKLDAASLLFPWHRGLLRIELQRPRNAGWRRWFGFGASAAAAAAPLTESLREFER